MRTAALPLIRKLSVFLCVPRSCVTIEPLTYLLKVEVIAAKTLTLTGWFGAVTSKILCFIPLEGQRGLAYSARALTLHGSPCWAARSFKMLQQTSHPDLQCLGSHLGAPAIARSLTLTRPAYLLLVLPL